MITMERASEIIAELSSPFSIDLFEHFVEFFDLMTEYEINEFAQMCGFLVVEGIRNDK